MINSDSYRNIYTTDLIQQLADHFTYCTLCGRKKFSHCAWNVMNYVSVPRQVKRHCREMLMLRSRYVPLKFDVVWTWRVERLAHLSHLKFDVVWTWRGERLAHLSCLKFDVVCTWRVERLAHLSHLKFDVVWTWRGECLAHLSHLKFDVVWNV